MAECWLVITAGATVALVFVTGLFLYMQNRTFRKQLKASLQLQMEDRFFFNPHMLAARKKLAEQIWSEAPHRVVQESIMNFFDTMGSFLRRNYLDKELICSSFSWYGTRWWTACKDYIEEENRTKVGGPFFEDFRKLVITFKEEGEIEPSPADIQDFLTEEKIVE